MVWIPNRRIRRSLNSAVCTPNRRIERAALEMDESDGLQSKSSNLTVCTIAKSEVLRMFCSPRTSLTPAQRVCFLTTTVKRELPSCRRNFAGIAVVS